MLGTLLSALHIINPRRYPKRKAQEFPSFTEEEIEPQEVK